MIKELSKEQQLEIIKEARTRFGYCQTFYKDSRTLSDADEKFTFGDGDNLFQWVDSNTSFNELQDAQQSGDIFLTINIAAQHKNQVVNSFKQGKPTGKVIAKGEGATAKSAKVMEGLLRHIKNTNNTDDKVAKAYDECVDSGEGYVWWTTEYEDDDSFNLVLRSAQIHRNCVYVDPNSVEPDKSDADYGFIFKEVTKDSLETQYKLDNVSSWESDNIFVKDKNVLIAIYYWCSYVADTLEQYEDGSIGYKSENKNKLPSKNSRKVSRKTWYWAKIIGGHDELFDYDEWMGKYLPIVAFRGVEKVIDGKWYCKGKTRDIKDSNKIVNYTWSSAVEALAAQPKAPYMIPVESLAAMPANLKALWDNPNKSKVPYLPYISKDPDTLESVAPPSREQPAFNPSAHINLMQIAMDNINVASGLHESNFGQEAPQKSGVAIRQQSSRGETSNYHFVDQAQIALKYQEKILLDLVPKIYNFEQVVRIVDFQGNEHEVLIDPSMDEATKENPAPKEGSQEFLQSVKYAFNPMFGKYDIEVDVGASWPTQRQETNQMLREFTQANPQYMANFGDFMFQTMDSMYADEMAERAKKMLDPKLLELNEEKQPDPQVQAQLQEMGNALEGAKAHVEQLSQAESDAKKKADSLEAQNNILKVKEQELQSMLRLEKAQKHTNPVDDTTPSYSEHESALDSVLYMLQELSLKVDSIDSKSQ